MEKIIFLLLFIVVVSCSVKPSKAFIEKDDFVSPDYEKHENWAASPFKNDQSDRKPDDFPTDSTLFNSVDVFFLHPTTYTGNRGQNHWNASLDDQKLNDKTDQSSILYQASLFNSVGRVFAPRYRQAHFHAYFTEDKVSAKKAFDLAYSDIRKSFEYYLQNHNQGRGIIIASHSQGTTHASRLIDEFFEGTSLSDQLIAAYLIGLPVSVNRFESFYPCEKPEEIRCICSWRTWKRGHQPRKKHDHEIIVTNPLSWTTEDTYVPKSMNKGGLITEFENGLLPGLTDAQVQEEVLWATKPKFKGSIFLTFKNYHRGDLNLYYGNIRDNAILRARNYVQHQVKM